MANWYWYQCTCLHLYEIPLIITYPTCACGIIVKSLVKSLFHILEALYIPSAKIKWKSFWSKSSQGARIANISVRVTWLKNVTLEIPRRWCGQSVNNVPLKLTCASVCLQPLFDVLWAGWKIFVSFPRCSFCHNLDRELNKLHHESDLSGLGLLVWEINCRWYGVPICIV